MFSRLSFKLFQPEEVKSLIEVNTSLIQNKLKERKNTLELAYQDRFRTYSIFASQGRLTPQDATSLINQEFPTQQKNTERIMNNLFFR